MRYFDFDKQAADLFVVMSATPLTRTAETALNDHDVVERVNQYSVHQILGVGSYGTVHRASSSGQDYAIKILRRPAPERRSLRRPTLTRPSSVPADEPSRPSLSRPISVGSSRTSRGNASGTENNSIEREFEVMSRLQHPNIVRLYELIDDPRCDQQFLVMECVRGWTLQRPVARRESIPEEDLRHWLREARGAEGRGGSASAAAHPPPAPCFRSTSAWSTCTSTESRTGTSSQADADRESAHPLHPPRRNLPNDRQTPL